MPGEGTGGSAGVVLASSGTEIEPGTPSYIRRPLGDDLATIYASVDVRIASIDDRGARVLTIVDAESAPVAALYASADGSIAIRWGEASAVTVVTKVPVAEWSRLELAVTVEAGEVRASVWLNGAGAWTGSAPTASTSLSAAIFGGWATDRSYRFAIDNVALSPTCTGECSVIVPSPTPAPTEPLAADPGTPADG
jgi:hypothetical protein